MIRRLLSGEGLRARALRGSALTVTSVAGSNLMRLGSNLILTRLLFPEAFGLMALVQVFVTGLNMFSDVGIRTSIIQNPREDAAFLNTAWTLKILRGMILWLMTWLIAAQVAALYDEPMLTQLLPVVGLSILITGFATTNAASQNRKLILGRLTAIDLGTQAINIVVMVALAWWLESVWALVIGGLVSSVMTVIAQHYLLPGIRNRLCWEWDAFRELFSFGKFIFLSTAVTFIITQGDKAILGAYVTMAELGVYNIGFFLGMVPQLVNGALMSKVVFPLYRLKPISAGPANLAQVFRARRLVIAASLCGTTIMAWSGVWLVGVMYDPRYALAGPIVVALSLALVPRLVLNTYGAVFLAMGDSKQFFYLNASTAALQTLLMFLGVIWFGIFGVVMAPALAILGTYPFRIHNLRKYDAWDPLADALLLGTFGLANGAALWWQWDAIRGIL